MAGFDAGGTRRMTRTGTCRATRDIEPGDCLAGELLPTAELQVGAVPLKASRALVKGIVSTGGAGRPGIARSFRDRGGAFGNPRTPPALSKSSAPGERVEAIRAALAAAFPAADVRTVRAVAGTESNVVLKMRASLLLLTL